MARGYYDGLGSFVALDAGKRTSEVDALKDELAMAQQHLRSAIAQRDAERIQECREEIERLHDEIRKLI